MLESLPIVPTVFHEHWWLQIASEGTYREAIVSSGGRVIGRLPYAPTRKFTGHRAVTMPPLTPELGPALEADMKGASDIHAFKRFQTTCELIDQLPSCSHARFELHRKVRDTLAFQAKGFASTQKFSVEIAADQEAVLWSRMRDKTRNVIRRAQEKYVSSELGPTDFVDFYEMNLRNVNLVNYHRRDICRELIRESLIRRSGRVLAASNHQGGLEAAIYTVWDTSCEYYLLTTRSKCSTNGAVSLLLWEAIKEAARCGRDFDMMGVRDAMMLNFFTGFGGSLKPRYIVNRSSISFDVLRQAKQFITHNKVSGYLRRRVGQARASRHRQ